MGQQKRILRGLIWRFVERFSVQIIQFVLQVILARILLPEDYGVLAIMLVFVNLANIFVQSGFNTALIQKKDVSDDDFSSIFWVSLLISIILFVILFFFAPVVGYIYDVPSIVVPFRCLLLVLIPGALNSVQLAKVSREFDFKKVFTSNIGGVVISGVLSVVVALSGGGVWALVVQSLSNVTISCLVMRFAIRWTPRFVCDVRRVKELFRFGWKILVSSLIDTLYQDIHSMIVGKKYSTETLGFYSRGKQFPQFIITGISSAISSVMLPALSANQDNVDQLRNMMRKSMITSAYLIFPMMTGMACVAKPLVSLILTDKWLPCVPYMQLYCYTLALYPVHICNLQAINALGRSDLNLKLEIVKKSVGLIFLIIAILFFNSPIAIVISGLISSLCSSFINAMPNKKLIKYSYLMQLKDLLPTMILCVLMGISVTVVGYLPVGNFLLLLIQVFTGLTVYLLCSLIIRPMPFVFLVGIIRDNFGKTSG